MKKMAFIIMILTVISKILGFSRDIILSYFYGASYISDAYLISQTIPNFIFSFISMGITAGFIPIYNKISIRFGNDEANKFTSNFINILMIFSTIFLIFGIIFSKQIVNLFASGFSGKTLSLSISFTNISMFCIYFYILNSIFEAFLQVKGNYIIPAMIGFPLNICTIIFIILSSKGNILLLGIGTLVSTFFQMILLYPFILKSGYFHRKVLNFKDENIKEIILLSLPIIIGVSIDQLNVLVDRSIASTIVDGGISALTYANRLNLVVKGLFVMPIFTVIYPVISRMAVENNKNGLSNMILQGINIISLLVFPISLFFMTYSREVVEILFDRGAFDKNAITMTHEALFFYSLGMVSFGWREVISRGFYSMQDTKTPTINATLAMLLNIALNIILSKYMGIKGLALATSISVITCTVLLFISFNKKMCFFDLKSVCIIVIKILLVIIPSIFISKILYNTINKYFYYNIVTISICFFIFIFLYISFILFMKIEEVDKLKEKIKNHIKKI